MFDIWFSIIFQNKLFFQNIKIFLVILYIKYKTNILLLEK